MSRTENRQAGLLIFYKNFILSRGCTGAVDRSTCTIAGCTGAVAGRTGASAGRTGGFAWRYGRYRWRCRRWRWRWKYGRYRRTCIFPTRSVCAAHVAKTESRIRVAHIHLFGTMAAHLQCTADMAARRVEDLIAYQFAEEFKLAVYDVINNSSSAQRSFKYREQLEDAAAGIERTVAEGFGRRQPAEFVQFLRYSLGSLAEARTCLRDGIHRKYFAEADCEVAFTWARRCRRTLSRTRGDQTDRSATIHIVEDSAGSKGVPSGRAKRPTMANLARSKAACKS